MAYDLNGAWDDFTGQNAPLYGRADEIGTETETLNVVWRFFQIVLSVALD